MKAVSFVVSMFVSMFSMGQTDSIASVVNQMNGVSYVSIHKKLDSMDIVSVQDVGANWVSVVPFSYMKSGRFPELHYDQDWFCYGDRLNGVGEIVRDAKVNGLKVLVKPQVWVSESFYTGKISMKKDKNWRKYENQYSEYILAFAKVAEEEGADMFCVGTEMKRFVCERPRFWNRLIRDVRLVFSGELIYAANWDDYESVPFWKKLDYIGVDAYFPISKNKEPTIKELKEGWKSIVASMDSLGKYYDKKIVLTEYGYRSIQGCAIHPWDYDKNESSNERAQVNALEALYQVIWGHNQFTGGFLWKWHLDHSSAGGSMNTMFTVQNKMAEKTVMKYYRSSKN